MKKKTCTDLSWVEIGETHVRVSSKVAALITSKIEGARIKKNVGRPKSVYNIPLTIKCKQETIDKYRAIQDYYLKVKGIRVPLARLIDFALNNTERFVRILEKVGYKKKSKKEK